MFRTSLVLVILVAVVCSTLTLAAQDKTTQAQPALVLLLLNASQTVQAAASSLSGELSGELSASLLNRTHANFVQRLVAIEQMESLLINKLLANDTTDGKLLSESRRILAQLRDDIKRIGVEALGELNKCFQQLNQIIFESKCRRQQQQQQQQPESTKRTVVHTLSEIGQMGVEFTIRTFEESQANFEALLDAIVDVELKLNETFAAANESDTSLAAECRQVVQTMKDMLANYEARALLTVHEAMLNLTQHLHSNLPPSPPANSSDDNNSNSTHLTNIEQFINRTEKLTRSLLKKMSKQLSDQARELNETRRALRDKTLRSEQQEARIDELVKLTHTLKDELHYRIVLELKKANALTEHNLVLTHQVGQYICRHILSSFIFW